MSRRKTFGGRVVFVGCYWYPTHCAAIVPGRASRTIEFAAAKRRYGAKQHVVDSVTNVGALVERLVAGGVLGVGWNDTPQRRVIDPDESLAAVLPRWTFLCWSTSRRVVFASGRHTYDFCTRA